MRKAAEYSSSCLALNNMNREGGRIGCFMSLTFNFRESRNRYYIRSFEKAGSTRQQKTIIIRLCLTADNDRLLPQNFLPRVCVWPDNSKACTCPPGTGLTEGVHVMLIHWGNTPIVDHIRAHAWEHRPEGQCCHLFFINLLSTPNSSRNFSSRLCKARK